MIVDERERVRAEIVRCAMAFTFGDHPGTDDLPTKGDALAALEAACCRLRELERDPRAPAR